jgi:hypothetical protein
MMLERKIFRSSIKSKSLLVIGTLAIVLLAGCSPLSPDRRLTEDEQSCQAMGHTPETANFKQCMADLNERRCAMSAGHKGNPSHHVVSTDCTRLN